MRLKMKTMYFYFFKDMIALMEEYAEKKSINLSLKEDAMIILSDRAKFTFGDTNAVLVNWTDVQFVFEELLEDEFDNFVKTLPDSIKFMQIFV